MKTTRLTPEQVARGPRYSHVRRYFYTAAERHRIYMNRYLCDLPKEQWTQNEIMSHYRFCNLYRELDKVTIWIREKWRKPYADHPNLAFAMAVARLINWPPTLEEIGFPKQWRPDRVLNVLHSRKSRGHKVYTGAYLLGGGIPPGQDRASYLVNSVLSPLYHELKALQISYEPLSFTHNVPCLEASWGWFRQHKGIGDFLAYEIVSDLSHTHYLDDAPDIMTWANAGPGALRGLARIWGYQPTTRQEPGYLFPKGEPAVEAMQMLLEKSGDRWPGDIEPWTMREVEHWLCEYDKYCRIKNGQGVLEVFHPKHGGEW